MALSISRATIGKFFDFKVIHFIQYTIMDPSEEASAGEVTTFRETQFLFYLLPCYYGVVALFYRYWVLLQIEPTYYVTHIPGERLLKNLQSEQQRARNSQALTFRVLPASYVIKSKLCLFNCYLYLAMILLSFVCSPTMFYSASHKFHSLLYLFGALAWYMAAIVLRREQQRNMGQSIWIHRLFWILAGTFSVYKMFEDYFLPINLFLNICLIISNLILAIYGIYRAEDSDTLIMVVSEDMPGFVKVFFQTIQLNNRIRYWLGIEDEPNQNLGEDTSVSRPEVDNQDLVVIGRVLKKSAETIKTEINLLNQLPRRNVFVDKKVRYMRVGDKFKSCYFILTQVGNSRFEAQRTIDEFQTLYSTMSEIFTSQNFPKHTLPLPLGLLGPDAEGNLSENLQSWFQEVLKTPIFIRKQLLQFLNVDSEKSAPFITYFQNSYSSFCSRHYLLIRHNKQREKQSTMREKRVTETLVGYYDPEIKSREPTDNEKILQYMKYHIEFMVGVESVVGQQRSIKFIITCLIDKKKRLYWDLKKTIIGLGILNQRIEQQCNCSVPIYYTLVGSIHTSIHHKLTQNCRAYLQAILNDKKYYCTSLFTFIKFDIIKQEVNTSGALLTFEPTAERKSRYIEEYEDHGAFIEVLKVDRVEPTGKGDDLYKLKIRRKELVLSNKTSEELRELRAVLAQLYKGVSFVPDLKLSNCSKLQVKNKVENFLLRIQNLPKIDIIGQYQGFYGNSLPKQ